MTYRRFDPSKKGRAASTVNSRRNDFDLHFEIRSKATARHIAKEEAESSQQMMMTLFKTSPLERENCEMVVEQFIQRFEQLITNIINYHLDKYQWDESELE